MCTQDRGAGGQAAPLEGAYITTVKLGPKGQIVIPKEIRERSGIRPGDSLLLFSPKGPGFMVQPLLSSREFLSKLLDQLPTTEEPS
ncbi:AbrB/MazE/SpoVT family DNA-binding domain-containing protein [Pseudoflavonifractor phocaeensis]|uniref:AbrB/MazE/SpoVT family DNA-binding domain-containing protein n=1 Tax=Pseudoflavonifractor phocaeensis TaxID=1870988 RepID=UPI00313C80F4